MNDCFDIQGYTISNVGKERNGDYYLFEYLEEQNLLIAAVADGVSRQPCDWLASETTCQKLLENFKSLSDQADISERLRNSIFSTNKYLINVEGNCRRMASTLSVIVWDLKINMIYYANIGDSRIYSLHDGKLVQLTKDDSKISKEKVFVHGGFRIIDKSTLTKVIGQDNISVNVVEKLIESGETIILASDGFYEARKASFNKIITESWKANNFQENFKMIVAQMETLRGDDFTTVMIKRKHYH